MTKVKRGFFLSKFEFIEALIKVLDARDIKYNVLRAIRYIDDEKNEDGNIKFGYRWVLAWAPQETVDALEFRSDSDSNETDSKSDDSKEDQKVDDENNNNQEDEKESSPKEESDSNSKESFEDHPFSVIEIPTYDYVISIHDQIEKTNDQKNWEKG